MFESSEAISRWEEVRQLLPEPARLPTFLPDGQNYPPHLNVAVELVDRALQDGFGNKICAIDLRGKWRYCDLAFHTDRLAWELSRRGVGPGTRILLRGRNSRILLAAWLAILKIGAIAVTVLPSLRHRELTEICRKARVSHAIAETEPELDDTLQHVFPRDILRYDERDPSWDRAPDPETTAFPAAATRADDVAIIAFTSGSTGEPKGCAHLHRDLLCIADGFARSVLKPEPDDLFCGTPALAFTFGLGALAIFPLRARAATLLLQTAGAAALLDAIRTYRPTLCFTAPTGYRSLLASAAQADLGSLRKAISAGEYLPPATRDAFRAFTGIEIIDGIGATEMLHIFIATEDEMVRPGAIGRVVPGYECRIVDETGLPVAHGTIGRLAVRGPTGCRYIDDDRQTTYVQQGWNITGDSFYQDDEGYFYFVARNDDIIISAGHKIAAPEVERALLRHPAVADCAVVGVPDDRRGQKVKAWIVRHPGEAPEDALKQDLLRHLRQELASFKHPREIDFTRELPRTDTGKLQRFRLRS